MPRLAIETATAACSVALAEGDDLLAERHELVGRGHAERLVPMIGEVLAAAEVRPTALLVDCGPGSFTGVRVGLAAAKALALAWAIPLGGVSSLALIAARGFFDRPDLDGLAVALTGGHGELFVQTFSRTLAGTPFRSLPPAAAAAAVADPLVLGSGAAVLVATRGWGEAVDAVPRAADMRLLPAGQAAAPPAPVYGRAPDARRPAAAIA